MKSKTIFTALATAAALLLAAAPALAHNLWLVPAEYNPQVGQAMEVRIGFGHSFPAGRIDQAVKPGMIGQVTALGPDGKEIALEKKADDLYTLDVKAAGPYMITAQMTPGFFSRAQGGMKRGNKQDVAGVETCMFFRMIANAPVFAGGGAAAQSSPKDQALQIVPLADPADLKAGDTLPVRVLFTGEPLVNTEIRATYAGFQAPDEDEVVKTAPGLSPKEAARQKMMRKMASHYPVIVRTDDQGKAEIKLSAPGWWLVLAGAETPYQNKAVCDKNMFKTTYTFEVK